MDRARKKIGPEYVDIDDWKNMVRLFVQLARHAHEFTPDNKPLKARLEKRFRHLVPLLAVQPHRDFGSCASADTIALTMAVTHHHWITTHYPHGPNDHWWVYLKSKNRKGGIPERGHKILFYETAVDDSDGKKGRKALVYAAEVVENVRDRVPPAGEFVFEIPCAEPPEPAMRHLGPQEMLKAIGLPIKKPLHSLKGLRPISEAQYRRLRAAMGI